jgi:hypothetical protein
LAKVIGIAISDQVLAVQIGSALLLSKVLYWMSKLCVFGIRSCDGRLSIILEIRYRH